MEVHHDDLIGNMYLMKRGDDITPDSLILLQYKLMDLSETGVCSKANFRI